ncbi:MAG TPA: mechanosensitive ion channel family protein [Stellaceae bacterium]|nr:mechanosensitive ion channel family protein [Stellaceae bacterium]
MMDMPSAAALAVRDPLVITMAIFSMGGVLTHLFFRRYPLARAMVRVFSLVVLTIVLLRAGVVPYQPLRLTGEPFQDAVHAALKIAWWLWTAWLLVGFLRVFVVTEHRPREGKLIQDLLAGVVYLSAIFAIISYVFDLPIRGLVATSGVIAIVLGLALQSTLSDLFSGIVLNFSRPYRPGDWISIDGATDGRVIEINWRATHVLTAKRDLAILPNSTIAKAKIVNASSPSGIHGMTVTVQLAANTPPATGVEILQQAVLNTRLILATPAPLIAVKTITSDAISIEVSFFVEELAHSTRAQNDLFDRISRHLSAAGIDLASTQNLLGWQPSPASDGAAKTAAERALDLVMIFASLADEERKKLAAATKERHYDAEEKLVRPGDILNSMSFIGAGVASITQLHSEGEIELLRLGPGDHFGEVGLLTGHAAEATVTALTAITIYELRKEDLAPVLEARQEVSREMCRALARRQAAGELLTSPQIDQTLPPSGVAAWFSERLHRLFDLASAE